MNLLEVQKVNNLLANSRNCLIGVSGGIDSMALLHCLVTNRKKFFDVNFKVMYVDHQLQHECKSWADFVVKQCSNLGIDCEVVKVSTEGLGNNVEYAARQARYMAFCNSGVDTLILAHHANDQCESFLLKLFRGSGIRGLKAMSHKSECWYDQKVTVVRPMLSVTRSQIESYVALNHIEFVEDLSNKDIKYDRNYIRNKIWPVITERFDIADINAVRSIQHLGEAWELTVMLAEIDLKFVTMTQNGAEDCMDWEKIKSLGYLRIKNLILHILDKENVYNFSVGHVESFSQGLLDATLDSKNELSLKGFIMFKLGKKIGFINYNKLKAA